MNSKFAKEIFIMILLFIVVMFTIGILFYEFMPSNDEKLSSIEYLQSDDVKATLAEIQANTGVDSSDDNTNSLLKSYSVNKEDLSGYQSENYYESGKKDPFAEYSERVEDEVVSVTNISKEPENTVTESPNTITNTSTSINTNTSSNSKQTNTVVASNPVKDNQTNTVKNSSKEPQNTNTTTVGTSDQSNTGTYFEKKGSK